VNGNCTNSNGACVDLKCGCIATHYIHVNGSNKDCQLSKFHGIKLKHTYRSTFSHQMS
jgi:hypothetical protein